jgi:hypothetical protein
VLLSRAVSLVAVAAALAGPVAAPAPGGVDLVPVLTSTPFGATGGQSVTHTILVSGTGTGSVTGVRVTFSLTVGLVGAVARTSQGQCSVVDELTVVCDLGVVNFPKADTAPPTVTISGTVKAGSVGGTLVQNLVRLVSATPDADLSNNVTSNAYLTPGLRSAPTVAAHSAAPEQRPGYLVPVIAGVLVAAVLASALLVRRRRR